MGSWYDQSMQGGEEEHCGYVAGVIRGRGEEIYQ